MQFVIDSRTYDRVLYGEGEDDLDQPTCDDCGVPRDEFHKLGCDLEPCPRCHGQAVCCDCFYENDKYVFRARI
jgi:hypothetical protein